MMATQPQLSSQSPDFFPQVQPRSSSERDNSLLLHAALKAASTDMAHRLLDYATLDKVDCEASCILISLANHDDDDNNNNNNSEIKKEPVIEKEPLETTVEIQEKQTELVKEPEIKAAIVVQTNQDNKKPSTPKNDPMMLLMAAAEVVNRQSSEEKRREYPNGRYYHRKSSDETPSSQHYLTKRMRPVSPPPPPPPPQQSTQNTTLPEKKKFRTNSNSSGHSSTMIKDAPTNSFSRQYHSMKQNPKIKQNALHAYITYMIYNDLAHHGGMRKQAYHSQPQRSNEFRGFNNDYAINRPSTDTNMITPSSTADNSSWFSSSSSSPNIPPPPSHDERSILSRPLTAFLWDANSNNLKPKEDKKDMMILPPLASKRPSSNNIYDRLPPL